MRRFNAKLFFCLVFGSALLVALTFLVHWLQTGRIAAALLAQADRAEQEKTLDQVVRYLSRYLELCPDDIEARARLGEALANDKVAVTVKARTRALFVLEQVLAKLPDRRDLRLRLVHLALALDRKDVARGHLTHLTQARADDGEAEFLFGQLAEIDKTWEQAAKWYRQAVQHAPQKIEGYVRLADVLRRHLAANPKLVEEAEQVMQSLAAQNKDNYQAFLARWRYQQEWYDLADAARLQEAAASVQRAQQLAPDDVEVLVAACDLGQAQKEPDKARAYLHRGRQLYPQDVRMYRELAKLELREARQQPNAQSQAHYRQQAIVLLREGAAALKGEARVELLWMLGNILIEAGETEPGQQVIADMTRAGASSPTVDYLQARIHVLNGRWSEGIRLLERCREVLATSPEVARQADLLLAQCYQKLNNPESELGAYSRLLARDPTSVPGLLGRAAAQAAAGQIDEALLQYQQVLRLPNVPNTVWLEVARLLMLRNLQTGTADWKQAEQALSQAAEKNADSPDIPLLRAEILAAQGRANPAKPAPDHPKLLQAQQLLVDLQKAHPERIEVWAALANLAEMRNQPEEAVRILAEAGKQVSDLVKLREAQVQFWVRRGGDEGKKNLVQLGGDLDKFNSVERGRLLAVLAEGHLRLGNSAEAQQLWERVAERPENQHDLRLRLTLFEVALRNGKEAVVQRMIGEMRQIEGATGVYWRYCKAVALISEARKGPARQGLDEARNLLDAVAAQRPAWPAVLIARAEVDDLKGNADQAMANYRKAIALGERQPRVVRQLVELLYKQQRFEEAEQEIHALQKQAPSTDLTRMLVDIQLRRDDPSRAVAQAFDAVSADSQDYRDHLWLGQVLSAGGQNAKEAEKHFRRAVELAGDKQETWLSLVHFLASTGNKQQAAVELTRAQARLPAQEAPLAVAVGYEAIGQFDKAQEYYERARSARPDDMAVLRSVAGFYLRQSNLTQAEPLLRSIIDGKVKATAGEQGWARRGLSLAVANTGDFRRFGAALALIGLKLDATGKVVESPNFSTDDPNDELRVRVRVLSRQPRRDVRRKAIALLEDEEKRQKLRADDQFILAQLYEADGNWPKARDILRQLTLQGREPLHLNYYAQKMLRQQELDEVERCVKKLAQLETDRKTEPGTSGSVEMRAQLLEARGQGAAAVELLKKYVGTTDPKADRVFALINCYGRLKRYPEALQLCQQLRSTGLTERVAGLTVALLRSAQAKEDQCAPVAQWLQEEIGKKPGSTLLLMQLADLEDIRGRYDEVEKRYRQVLAKEERNVLALNNLAWLLAQQRPDKTAEALAMVNRAIEQRGAQPDLLDTRASVYLAQQRTDLAIADLESANDDRPDPTRYFHLAQAHRLANNAPAAASLLKKATASGLKAEHLHPVERVAFTKLLNEMEQR